MYDELVERLRAQAEAERYFSGEEMLYDKAADAIEELSAEERPVKRGKWIMNDECGTVCSLCGNVVAFVSRPDKQWDLGNYCPNCGAYMRGES